MIIKNITEYIGNTPLLEISKEITGLKHVNLYAKCELFNPFGSLKDRAGFAMLEKEIEELKKNGKTVIESSSGNTAKAMATVCSINGIPFKTVTNRIKIPETKDILKIVGATIEELPGISECPDPSDPNDPVQYIERTVSASCGKYFHPNQYTNLENPNVHFSNTGPEIWNDLKSVDYFFGTLGTTGSTRGTIEFLLTKNPNLKKIGIIAEKGDTIPGIRNKDEMHEVGIFDVSLYDDIVGVNSVEAVDSMLDLIRKEGLLAGPTTGAALKGSIDYLKKIDNNLNQDVNAVFIACDRVEWYVSYIKKRRPEIFDESIEYESVRNISNDDLKYSKEITTNEFNDFVSSNSPIIIDLRGSMAFKNGHIQGSINITDMFFDDIVDSGVPFSKESIVLLVCAIGDKSKRYSAFLNKKGIKAYSLSGGMAEYRDSGMPLERNIKRMKL